MPETKSKSRLATTRRSSLLWSPRPTSPCGTCLACRGAWLDLTPLALRACRFLGEVVVTAKNGATEWLTIQGVSFSMLQSRLNLTGGTDFVTLPLSLEPTQLTCLLSIQVLVWMVVA